MRRVVCVCVPVPVVFFHAGIVFFFILFFLFHSQQRIPQIWAAGVIRLSHILLHHQSLDMTTDWWWFQRLRVMTALSPYLWSHFAICLSSPFPSHHPAWQFKVKLSSAAARNIREPLTNQEWLTSTGRNAAVERDASCAISAQPLQSKRDISKVCFSFYPKATRYFLISLGRSIEAFWFNHPSLMSLGGCLTFELCRKPKSMTARWSITNRARRYHTSSRLGLVWAISCVRKTEKLREIFDCTETTRNIHKATFRDEEEEEGETQASPIEWWPSVWAWCWGADQDLFLRDQ